jgi:autotransporter-associated beta strand protein
MGSGTLSLTAGNTINGATTVSAGTLQVGAGQTLRANGLVNIRAGAQLTLGGGAKLDLTNQKMIVAGGSVGAWNGSNYDGVTGQIRSARNGGVGGGAWNGSGITTSMTDASSPNRLTSLAVAMAGDVGKTTFAGTSVSSSDVLAMYTYTGDANLSGKIDADDYFQIDSHFNKSANSAMSWFNGDFNYDGKINGDDYFLIDNAYVGQGAPFGSGGLASGESAVPEPLGLGWVGFAVTAFARRRRRIS